MQTVHLSVLAEVAVEFDKTESMKKWKCFILVFTQPYHERFQSMIFCEDAHHTTAVGIADWVDYNSCFAIHWSKEGAQDGLLLSTIAGLNLGNANLLSKGNKKTFGKN